MDRHPASEAGASRFESGTAQINKKGQQMKTTVISIFKNRIEEVAARLRLTRHYPTMGGFHEECPLCRNILRIEPFDVLIKVNAEPKTKGPPKK